MELPDFLCVGAAKTGTNWLAKNLNFMDEIFIPPFHEARYFDSFEMSRQEVQVGIYERCIVANQTIGAYLEKKNVNPNLFKWYANWAFTNDLNDDWYAGLYAPGKGKIKGDISPSYHMLSDSSVEKISQLLPSAKIIFIMRYPADIVWSFYQMNKQMPAHRKPKVFIENNSDFFRLLEAGMFDANTYYLKSIKKWAKYFPKDQLFYCYYDDLETNGENFLYNVADFLGVEKPKSSAEIMSLRYNTTARNIHGIKDPITDIHKKSIAERYHQSIVDLAEAFGGHAEAWEKRMLIDMSL